MALEALVGGALEEAALEGLSEGAQTCRTHARNACAHTRMHACMHVCKQRFHAALLMRTHAHAHTHTRTHA